MRNRVCKASMAVAAIGLFAAAAAQAQPCTMLCPNGSGAPLVAEFATLPLAQTGCKGDEVVWIQNRRVYHKAGWRKFGKAHGSYICKASAKTVNLKPANFFQRFL